MKRSLQEEIGLIRQLVGLSEEEAPNPKAEKVIDAMTAAMEAVEKVNGLIMDRSGNLTTADKKPLSQAAAALDSATADLISAIRKL